MIQGHGGNIFALARELGCQPEDIADMSSNINPLGPPPGLLAHLQAHLTRIGTLPDVDGATGCRALARLLDLDPDWILAGSGTTQFIYEVCRVLKTRRALIVGPTYADYADACRGEGVCADLFLTQPEDTFQPDLAALETQLAGVDTLFVCTPNNPTGSLTPLDELANLARRHPALRLVLDASYLPFSEPQLAGSLKPLVQDDLRQVLVLWSGSKIFAMPGLRAGFLIAHPDLLTSFRPLARPWTLGTLAQEAMLFLAENREAVERFVRDSHAFIQQERAAVQARLADCAELRCLPSSTSFFLLHLPPGLHAEKVCQALLARRVLIRNCANFTGLDRRFIRAALKDRATNAHFAELLRHIVLEHRS